jgi:EAL domain-containing protein (putative c-di-GMP-specific phosphodiesterase class I)
VSQFKRGGLVETVKEALNESGLDPACLELEMTETILVKDPVNVLATVQQLKALGVRIAIDDFGTGYSSLAHLKRLNADRVKIDHSFIRDIVADANGEAIVRAIVHVARSLGLGIVAEGVEDEVILAALRRHGCDDAQGFHFAGPMPPEKLAAFLRRNRRIEAAE